MYKGQLPYIIIPADKYRRNEWDGNHHGTTLTEAKTSGWGLNKKQVRFPWWLSRKESACQCRRPGFHSWSGKIPHTTGELSPCTTTIKACALEPGSCNHGALVGQLLKSACPKAYAPQQWSISCLPQEKPPQWEAHVPQLESRLNSLQLEKKPGQQQKPSTAKNK